MKRDGAFDFGLQVVEEEEHDDMPPSPRSETYEERVAVVPQKKMGVLIPTHAEILAGYVWGTEVHFNMKIANICEVKNA